MADTVIDPTVDTQVYIKQGAAEAVIGPTGVLNILTGGKILAAGVQAAHVPALTDNSGGAASDTIAAISDTATKNAVASLAAKVNALIAADQGIGTLAAS